MDDRSALQWLATSIDADACYAPGLPRAHLRRADLSVQIEAAALRLHKAGHAQDAQHALRIGRRLLESAQTPGGLAASASALRLYDLAAVLALKQGGSAGTAELGRLADELAQRLGAPQESASAAAQGVPALQPKYPAPQRRRRDRRPDAAAEARFLADRLRQRIANWRSPSERWRKRWQSREWTLRLDSRPFEAAAAARPGLPGADRSR